LKYRALSLGRNYVETPIIFVEREDGSSKMSGKIIFEGMYQVARLAFTKNPGR